MVCMRVAFLENDDATTLEKCGVEFSAFFSTKGVVKFGVNFGEISECHILQALGVRIGRAHKISRQKQYEKQNISRTFHAAGGGAEKRRKSRKLRKRRLQTRSCVECWISLTLNFAEGQGDFLSGFYSEFHI